MRLRQKYSVEPTTNLPPPLLNKASDVHLLSHASMHLHWNWNSHVHPSLRIFAL